MNNCQICNLPLEVSPVQSYETMVILPINTPFLRGNGRSHYNILDQFNDYGFEHWKRFSAVTIATDRVMSQMGHYGCKHGFHLPCLLNHLATKFNSTDVVTNKDYIIRCRLCSANCRWFCELRPTMSPHYWFRQYEYLYFPEDQFYPELDSHSDLLRRVNRGVVQDRGIVPVRFAPEEDTTEWPSNYTVPIAAEQPRCVQGPLDPWISDAIHPGSSGRNPLNGHPSTVWLTPPASPTPEYVDLTVFRPEVITLSDNDDDDDVVLLDEPTLNQHTLDSPTVEDNAGIQGMEGMIDHVLQEGEDITSTDYDPIDELFASLDSMDYHDMQQFNDLQSVLHELASDNAEHFHDLQLLEKVEQQLSESENISPAIIDHVPKSSDPENPSTSSENVLK